MVFIEKTRDGVVSAVTDVEVRDVVCGQNHVVSPSLICCLCCSVLLKLDRILCILSSVVFIDNQQQTQSHIVIWLETSATTALRN